MADGLGALDLVTARRGGRRRRRRHDRRRGPGDGRIDRPGRHPGDGHRQQHRAQPRHPRQRRRGGRDLVDVGAAAPARPRRRHRPVGRTAVRRERRWRAGDARHRGDGSPGRGEPTTAEQLAGRRSTRTPTCSASPTRSRGAWCSRRRADRGRVPAGRGPQHRLDRPEPRALRDGVAVGRKAHGGGRHQRRPIGRGRVPARSTPMATVIRRACAAGTSARWPSRSAIGCTSTTKWSASRARSGPACGSNRGRCASSSRNRRCTWPNARRTRSHPSTYPKWVAAYPIRRSGQTAAHQQSAAVILLSRPAAIPALEVCS